MLDALTRAGVPRHASFARPRRLTARPPFECIALVLQGGGALGSYQAGAGRPTLVSMERLSGRLVGFTWAHFQTFRRKPRPLSGAAVQVPMVFRIVPKANSRYGWTSHSASCWPLC